MDGWSAGTNGLVSGCEVTPLRSALQAPTTQWAQRPADMTKHCQPAWQSPTTCPFLSAWGTESCGAMSAEVSRRTVVLRGDDCCEVKVFFLSLASGGLCPLFYVVVVLPYFFGWEIGADGAHKRCAVWAEKRAQTG